MGSAGSEDTAASPPSFPVLHWGFTHVLPLIWGPRCPVLFFVFPLSPRAVPSPWLWGMFSCSGGPEELCPWALTLVRLRLGSASHWSQAALAANLKSLQFLALLTLSVIKDVPQFRQREEFLLSEQDRF